MIDERMEEQSSLHVLGLLTEAEDREFKQALQADPELRQLVAKLSAVSGALAGNVPLVEPPPSLRAKVLSQVEPQQKVVSLPERKPGLLSWLPWVFAGGLAVLCIILFAQDGRLRRENAEQTQRLGEMDQLARQLQAATNDLQRTVLALQETNELANLRVAMLKSLVADAPKTVAVSLWDSQKQDGIFVGENLKPLPSDRDYELWVIDETQTPVAAGVFHVDQNGKIRMDFKPSRLVKTAGTFAVTEEVKGGVASPTLKNMVLAGN